MKFETAIEWINPAAHQPDLVMRNHLLVRGAGGRLK